MGQYDDDEHGAAYERARDYAEFANIVHNYDDTARGNHDDIDFNDIDHDGAEYDDNGNPVIPIDLADYIAANPAVGIIIAVCDSIDQFGTTADDYEFCTADNFYEAINYDYDHPCLRQLNHGTEPFHNPYKPLRGFYGADGNIYPPGLPDAF
jgi:hypothetical protein